MKLTFKMPGLNGDQRGIAAIEFALLLPFLAFVYLGTFEITQAISVKHMTAIAASTVANIVTQYPSISQTNDMPDILNAAAAVLTPYPVASAVITVTLIQIDKNGTPTVSWSQSLNGPQRPTGSSIGVPNGLDIPNTSLVFGEATYNYVPLFNYFGMGSIGLYDSVYMFPRSQSGTITLTN
jgi:Flp pilus assembly protein TadG